jgi:hypothetical protein
MTGRPDVEEYLDAVRAELADLQPNERDELLEDVEASLLDAAEETDAPLAARLGSPADFAAELRAAAGLHRPEASPRARLRDVWRRPEREAVTRGLVELAPIWWLARAYVAVAVVAWLFADGRDVSPPEVFRLGTPDLGFVLLTLAAAVSVALGFWLRRRGRMGTVALVANLALAVAAVPVYGNLLEWVSNRQYVSNVIETASPTPGLTRDGIPVDNIYPYSRSGRLLLDVVLYDQNGLPLNVRVDDLDPSRRVLRTRTGAPLLNTFPIRHVEPGTRRVAHPRATPPVDWSPIATPALGPTP